MDTTIATLETLYKEIADNGTYSRETVQSTQSTLYLLKKEQARGHRISTFVEMLNEGRREKFRELQDEARFDWKHSDNDEEDALYWHDVTLLQEAFMIWYELSRAPVGLPNEPVSVD